MSRPAIITFLKALSIVLWIITAGIFIAGIVVAVDDAAIPWLDPLEGLIGVAIAGIGGLVARLTAQRVERGNQQTVYQGAGAQGERAKALNVGGDNQGQIAVADTVNQFLLGISAPITAEKPLDTMLTQYLVWLQDFAGTIELRGVRRADGQVIQLDLEQVYVPLEAMAVLHEDAPAVLQGRPIEEMPRAERVTRAKPQEISLDRVLTLGRRLVITGGPGCGKTTVLRHVAWTLATAYVTNDPSSVGRRLGLPDELPIPIYIPLSAFADHLRTMDKAKETRGHYNEKDYRLDYFIPRYLVENQATFGLPEDFFSRLLERGDKIILLLDGLDEVPDEMERRRVREKVEQLVTGRREKMRVVVTCRTAAYREQTALGMGFREARVKPLEDAHVAALVTNAYEYLYRRDPRKRQDKTTELLDGIRRLEEDRRRRLGDDAEPLVTSPLMVRMFLIVHQSEERRLPDQRAELFMKATDAMLLPDYALDEDVADRLGRLIGGRKEMHRDLTQHLAFQMHSRGDQQGREIDEDGLREVLGADATFAPFLDDFIALTRLRGTLLEELLGTYRFIHLVFQEFLAARYLAEVRRGEGGVDAVAGFLESGPVLDSWWRETALLVPGYLSVTAVQNALGLLRRLAGIDEAAAERNRTLAPDVQLAAAEIAAVSVMEWQTGQTDLRQTVAGRLAVLLTDPALALRPSLRGLAGQTLGRLGDPRPEVTDVDAMEFCFVPRGPFVMGSARGEPDARDNEFGHDAPLDVLYDYWLGRFPITNGQYETFIAGGGYGVAGYWPEARQAQRWRAPGEVLDWRGEWRARPYDWGETAALANHPRTGVTWFEALAFGRWLADRWRVAGLLPAGWEVRLASEMEWEKAARGGLRVPIAPLIRPAGRLADATDVDLIDQPAPRRFPWGDAPPEGRGNYDKAGVGRLSAAGCFPAGRGVYGHEDLAGNVWEWTRTKYAGYPYIPEDGRETPDSRSDRVLRGGAYYSEAAWLRGAFRGRNYRDYSNDGSGFRVAVTRSKYD